MAVRDAQFFRRILQAVTRFYRDPKITYAIVDGRYFAKKPTLRLIRFLLPLYRRYSNDEDLLNKVYLNQESDFNIRRLLTQPEPILANLVYDEFEKIKSLPLAQQDDAQMKWVQKLESGTPKIPEITLTPEKEFTPSIPPINTTPNPVLPTITTPSFVKDLLSNTQIFIKGLVDKYATPMRVASVATGIIGAITGYGIAGTTGAIAGSTAAVLPAFLAKGGGETILNTGFRTINTGSDAVIGLFNVTNLINVFPVRLIKLVIFGIIGAILAVAILGSGSLGETNKLPSIGDTSKSSNSFIGVNVHYLANLATNTPENPNKREKLEHILSYLSNSCGVSVIRIWGTGSAQELKKTLDLGTQYNVKFIIALADFANRTSRDTLIPLQSGSELTNSPAENPTSWYRDGYKGTYLAHARDTVTYLKDHPSVYAWELANEPHCAAFADCPEAYTNWIKDVSGLIKSIDTKHLVSIGTQANADFQLGESVNDGQYEKINSISTIGALSGHYYNGSIQGVKDPNEFSKEKALMLKELEIAKKLNKPFYIGEAGFVCDVASNSNCIQASFEKETDRAQQLKVELTEFFNAGATGYLVWQYSDRKSDNIENDMFSFFEGDPMCQVMKEAADKLKVVPTSDNLASCQFTRSGTSLPIKSTALNKLITDVASTQGIPAPILASIAMHESASFIANADDNHDSILQNNYCQAGPVFCEKNGQRLHEEDKPCTSIEIVDGARTAKAIGLMQIIDVFNPGKNLCSLTESLTIAAEKLKANGITGNPTKDQVISAIRSYYNSCTYGSFNYCEEVWQDLQNCKQIFDQPSGCPVIGTITNPFGHSIANYPYINEGCNLPTGTLQSCHNGIDIGATPSTPVRSTMAGIVAERDFNQFKGNYIKITNSTGFSVYLEHLKEIPAYEIGEDIQKGEVIGLAGSTGEGTTGTHVHYRVEKNNSVVNPLIYTNNIQNPHPALLLSSENLSLNNYLGVNMESINNFGVCNTQP